MISPPFLSLTMIVLLSLTQTILSYSPTSVFPQSTSTSASASASKAHSNLRSTTAMQGNDSTERGAPLPFLRIVDFSKANIQRRAESVTKENLIKACGKSKSNLNVLDLTCGLGVDSYLLARTGAQVCAIERDDRVFAAVSVGFLNAKEVKDNVTLIFGDSLAILKEIVAGERVLPSPVDVIYIDVMFDPAKKNRSKAKGGVQALRNLLDIPHTPAEDGDSDEGGERKNFEEGSQLLKLSQEVLKVKGSAACRVIVKRGKNSRYLNDARPSFQINEKGLCRFDVYPQMNSSE